MSKKDKNPKINIDLNLLRPQGESTKILSNIRGWLFSGSTMVLIVTEIIALIILGIRYKLDSDLIAARDAITTQINYIQQNSNDELLIKKAHLKMSSIKDTYRGTPNYSLVIQKVAKLQPQAVKLNEAYMETASKKVALQIKGQTQNNANLAAFLAQFKKDSSFEGMDLSTVSIDQTGLIKFTIQGTYNF